MTEFKVGDRVEVIGLPHNSKNIRIGMTATVVHTDEANDEPRCWIVTDEDCGVNKDIKHYRANEEWWVNGRTCGMYAKRLKKLEEPSPTFMDC